MEIEKLIKHMRKEAQDYRAGRTLGRAFADAEDVLDEASTALEQLQAENDRLKEEVQQMRWISVEERLPGDSDGAVLLTNEKTVIIGYRNQLFGLDGQYGIFAPAIKKGGGYMQVTHWMPLPKLPKEEPNGKK